MPQAFVNGVHLYYEVTGSGFPLVFAHEFAGDCRSWDHQVRFFARRYQVITYNARGYPPSEVLDGPDAYSQDLAVGDLHGLLGHLGIAQVHLCGLSMGSFAVLHFGLRFPSMARSLVVAGCGYGTDDPERFRRDSEDLAARIERDGMAVVGAAYAQGPTRLAFKRKDPLGWAEFAERLGRHSGPGSAGTQRGVQAMRPALPTLTGALRDLRVPTLIINGDEDEPCLQAGLFLKREVPSAALLVLPSTGHTINLEEPGAFNAAVLEFLTAVESGRWPVREAPP